jgi:hypothetical protein
MQFLSPIYLLGFLAISAPILIHLIRRRKVTVIPWAAHRFLVSVTMKLQKRKRVDDLILLLLRCFLFILLALLFARPFLLGSKGVIVDESDTLVVLVDASASMGYSNGVHARFDAARDHVEAALDGLSESTAVALILFADQAYPVVSPPTMEHRVILQELERQSPRPGQSNVTAGLSAALELLASRGGGSVLLVSDGQTVAWQDKVELSRLIEDAEEQSVSIKILNVAEQSDASNLGIIAFESSNLRPITGQVVPLQLVVKNGGNTLSSETRIVLEQVAGFPIVEAWVPALQPGEAGTVPMQTTFTESGWQCLTARLSGDNMAADNSRSIGLLVSKGRRVGIVEGSRNPDLNVDPGFFLSAAAVPVSGAEARSFPVQVSLLEASEITHETLSQFRVIALAGVSTLNRAQVDALTAFVENGGGLWLVPPSEDAAVGQFVASPLIRELLPIATIDRAKEGSGGLPAAAPYDHPITGFWNDRQSGSLEAFYIDRMLRIEKSDTAEGVLSLSNGNLLFVAQQRGAGRVFCSAIPLDGAWTELPLSPQFVPLVQRTLAWLSGSVDTPPALSPGEGWRVRVPPIHVGRPFYISTPLTEGESKTAGLVEFQEGQAILTYSDTRSLGRYILYLDPDGEPVGSFGVNLDPIESDLRQLTVSELAEFTGSALEMVTGSGESTGMRAKLSAALPELWKILIFFILITGAVEFTLAQRFSRSQ